MHRAPLRTIPLLAVVAAVLLAGACSQQARAERDGRDLAEAVCDLHDATDPNAQSEAKDEIAKALDDIVGRFGAATAEDRADIQNNLADLAEHVIQGNKVLAHQDLTVLERSAHNIRQGLSDVQRSAWNGFSDGLRGCMES